MWTQSDNPGLCQKWARLWQRRQTWDLCPTIRVSTRYSSVVKISWAEFWVLLNKRMLWNCCLEKLSVLANICQYNLPCWPLILTLIFAFDLTLMVTFDLDEYFWHWCRPLVLRLTFDLGTDLYSWYWTLFLILIFRVDIGLEINLDLHVLILTYILSLVLA